MVDTMSSDVNSIFTITGVAEIIKEALERLDWTDSKLYVAYKDRFYSMGIYIKKGDGRWKDCFSENLIDRGEIIIHYARIDNLLHSHRKDMEESEKWNVLTFSMNNSGDISANFSIEEISEVTGKHKKNWEKKYLLGEGE